MHATSYKISSQPQHEPELWKFKREELEKQYKAELRNGRHCLEIEKQMQLREFENQQFEEEHHEQVAAAAREEIELMTKSSADGSDTGILSELFTERNKVKSKKLVQGCAKSSPAGNIADVANEPSLHLSGFIAQSNQATVFRPIHFNLWTRTLWITIHMFKLSLTSTSVSKVRRRQVIGIF